MKISNQLTGIINFITLLLSIPIIGVGIWLATKHNTDCVRFLQWPIIITGIFILVVSVAGFVGSCFRVACLLWLYLSVMFLLILLLLSFTVFAFVVTNQGAGHTLSGKGFREYRLGDFSTWLQRRVQNNNNWHKIQSCLRDANVCSSLRKYTSLSSFNAADLSPLQSGCCKPPTACGFTFQNATFWVNPANTYIDRDCTRWSNDQTRLCFSCYSCRAGVLYNIKHDWRKVAAVNIVVLVVLIVIYSVGCAAFHNARREGYYSDYGKGRGQKHIRERT